MSQIDDGGPAFPSYKLKPDQSGIPGMTEWETTPGQSLRAYFAGQAITGSIGLLTRCAVAGHEFNTNDIKSMCVQLADALIAELKRVPEESSHEH